MALFSKFLRSPAPRPERSRRTRLYLETLESRIVPYTNSGYLWPHPQLVTISFVPDGTVLTQSFNGPVTSNLFYTFNGRFGSPATWQNVFLKAAQLWAQQTNINFAVVSDRAPILVRAVTNRATRRLVTFASVVTTSAPTILPAPTCRRRPTI